METQENTLRKNKNLYWAWKSMKQRVFNPNCKAYKNYGGRGISICKEWEFYEPFYYWAISNGWKPGLDLDRIKNDGDYCPSNCRWTSRKKNINNRRCTIMVSVGESRMSISEWSDISGIPIGSLKVWFETKGEHYVSNRIEDAIKNGYRPRDFGNTHRKRVILEDTGEVFQSVRDAAKKVGLAPCTISNAMREGRRTGKGRFQWEFV